MTSASILTRRPVLAAAVALLAGLALAWLLLVGRPAPAPEIPAAPPPPQVDVLVAEPGSRRLTVYSQGSAQAQREIDLVSRVAGTVDTVADSFADGAAFAAGEALVTLESVDYEIAVTAAESRLAEAKRLLAEEKGRARQARREWRDLGNLEANALFLREPQVAAAQAAVEAASAELRRARLDLSRTRISAPFAGRILSRGVNIGQYITPGTPVARVYASAAVEVQLPLTNRQLALVDLPLGGNEEAGPEVMLSATLAGERRTWRGRLVRTAASVDPQSRVLYAIVEVPEPLAAPFPLLPGVFVEAAIPGRPLADVVTLPRSALRNDDSVWVVDAEDRLQPRAVSVLHSGRSGATVRGLRPGERVLLREPAVAVAGMAVTPRQVPADVDGVSG